MAQHRIFILLAASVCSVLTFVAGIADAGETIVNNMDILYIGKFSAADPSDGIPSGWEPLTFNKIENLTDYRLIDDNAPPRDSGKKQCIGIRFNPKDAHRPAQIPAHRMAVESNQYI